VSNRKFRILCIDGGGLRGVIPIQVLKMVESITKKPIHKSFDLIAGTSTGGLLACALTIENRDSLVRGNCKFSLEEIEELYISRGKEIFPKNKSKVAGWVRPLFSPDNISGILSEYFGESRITHCLKPIFLTSFNIHRNRPVFFTTREASQSLDKNSKLVEICKATSAAPTYFPSHTFTYDGESTVCIDGGVVMNNPTIGALIEVLGNPDYKHYKIDSDKQIGLEDISILSLGTGKTNNNFIAHKSEKWGRLQWAKPLVDIFMCSPGRIIHKQIETLFDSFQYDKNYLRINIDIDEQYSEMSDSREETLRYLLEESNSQITNNDTLLLKLEIFLKTSGLLSNTYQSSKTPNV